MNMELELEIALTKKEQRELEGVMNVIRHELHHLAYQYGETCIMLNRFISSNNLENDEPAKFFASSMDECIFATERMYNYANKRLKLLQQRYDALEADLEELSEYDNDIPY